MRSPRPLALLLQLPIPPAGRVAVRGNVPLAAGCLSLFARRRGMEDSWRIEILPGTAFRERAAELGLSYQSRPPYYVLSTPTLDTADVVALMAEAQEAFGTEFDPLPPPDSEPPRAADRPAPGCVVDFDRPPEPLPPAHERTQAFTLWLRANEFRAHARRAAAIVAELLSDNPHTTLQVVFDAPRPEAVDEAMLAAVEAACYRTTSYLDRYYSLHPNPTLGAKRLVVVGTKSDAS